MKLAALVLVIVALGLPLNDLPRYALLVVAAVLVFTGTVSTSRMRWLGALAVAGFAFSRRSCRRHRASRRATTSSW